MKILSTVSQYKGEINYTFSSIVTAAVSLLSGLLAAYFIEPEDLGTIQTVLLVSTYAGFLNLGVFSGLNRNLAYYKAQGRLTLMQDEIDTSHFVSVIIAAIGFILGFSFFLFYLINGKNNVFLWSSVLLIITLIFTPLNSHYDCTFRSGQEFARLGRIRNWQAVIYLLFSFFPAFCGYIGRIVASSCNAIVGYIFRVERPPYKHVGHGTKEALKDLFVTGFPLMIGGYLWTILNVADRTFIASNLSMKDVGLYTISNYVVTLFSVIPTALNTLLYPKAASIYGKTGDKSALLSFWKKSVMLFTAVLIPLCMFFYFVLPPAVKLFMPKYVDGIHAAQITLLTCCTYISMGPSVIFGTFRQNKSYIVFVLLMLGLFWAVALVFRNYFCTIERVAYLRFISSLIFMFFILIKTYSMVKE